MLVERLDGTRPRMHCPACGFVHYRNPVAAAGGIICRRQTVCLVRRSVEPRRGHWSLPAGFVEYDEAPRACAVREIAEETGLAVAAEELLGVYTGFDDPRQHAVLIVYWMRELAAQTPIPGDDADAVDFFAPETVPAGIAFRAHRQALDDVFASSRYRAGRENGEG